MKLKIVSSKAHKQTCTAVAWSRKGQVYAASDDKSISVWNAHGERDEKITVDLENYATDIDWMPQVGTQLSNKYVVSFTNGSFAIFRGHKMERVCDKNHHGAIISLRWNHEASAIATAGEDGSVRVYSSNAMLRATLGRGNFPVYSISWAPNDDRVLFARAKDLVIRSAKHVDGKEIKWKAHDGIVMKVDWNQVNNKIVSCGEDCKYKVWDSFGRLLFQSSVHNQVLTSVRWSPNGSLFAVGSYNLIRLCDETGWSYSRNTPESGSILNLSWSADGTDIAGAGGNGSVVLAQLVDRQLDWKNIQATLVGSSVSENKKEVEQDTKRGDVADEIQNRIVVKDVIKESSETLEFRNRVVEMALGFGYLVVATESQCFIYDVHNWHTPHIFDLRYPVSLIKQCDRFFVMLNAINGVQIFNYDGRNLCNPKFSGLRVECLSDRTMSVAIDTLAILNPADRTRVYLYEVTSGKAIGAIHHTSDISEIDLSRYSRSKSKLLSFIDVNRDLHIVEVSEASKHDGGKKKSKKKNKSVVKIEKIATMVDSSEWNDSSDVLVAVSDGTFKAWYYPQAVLINKDLFQAAAISRDGTAFGKRPYIESFFGPRVTIRRNDGALVTISLDPYPPILYQLVTSSRWNEAVRLCRFVKQDSLWSALAVMALDWRNLDTTEIALAALGHLDKLEFIKHINNVPSKEGQAAELALYRGKVDEAEQILLQASPPLIYRAIKMNIRLFRWVRALEIAVKNKEHVDIVLAHRKRFLEQCDRTETEAKFIRHEGKVKVDWDAIKARQEEERQKERDRSRRGNKKN